MTENTKKCIRRFIIQGIVERKRSRLDTNLIRQRRQQRRLPGLTDQQKIMFNQLVRAQLLLGDDLEGLDDALCDIGAKLKQLAMRSPEALMRFDGKSAANATASEGDPELLSDVSNIANDEL